LVARDRARKCGPERPVSGLTILELQPHPNRNRQCLLARVRRREAARSQELWGKKVEYKLLIYDPVVYDYPTWRARTLKSDGPFYSPGRFSVARESVYIDHEFCVKRAQAQPPATQSLGIEGILKSGLAVRCS